MSDSGREYRKVYRSITSSERLASVSDAAAWLYVLVLVSQDDEGRYPWTRAMVRTLTATRPDWSFADTSTLLHELVNVELASIEDELVVLRRGSELNGIPRSAHERRQYQAPAVLRQGVTQGAAKVPLDIQQGSHGSEGEGEESSPPTGAHRARTREHQPIDDGFIKDMVVEFADALGGEDAVLDAVGEATNHKAILKRIDKRRYLRTWLKKEVTWAAERRNGTSGGPSKHAAGARASDERFARETADG